MLVGAPKDHNLQPGTNRSGALWKCPFTTNSSDCVQVHTDGFKDNNGQLLPPSEDEIKDDQWLGVTVRSQGMGGEALVCAHRYMQRGPGFQWGFGLCYLLSQDLDVTDSMEPCRGKTVAKGHEQFGFCQAGMSGIILKDEVVLGLPGPYTWRGTVHTSNISKNFLFRDKTQYFGPVTENDSPVDKYSYLGYSVTAGRFLGDYVSYVGGAPRSNGTGQVVFFSRENIGESLLVVDLILDGEKFASSFGFEVLSVDINNDGFDDLVVGAPFYYTQHSSGAVYVYINSKDGIKRDSEYIKLEGPPGESRFGFSLTSLGDLNRDGYRDIAIGAPYEDRGAIYIYLGSKNGLVTEPSQVRSGRNWAIYIYLGSKNGLVTKPSQVIRASDLPGPAYDAFGYALSGGLDMDNNGYPDLLTSSFCSDRVVLIRSRPVVAITTLVLPEAGIRDIDPSKPGCPDNLESRETCFSFDACFLMESDAGTRTGLLLKYSIEERVYKDQPLARVHFYKDAELQPSQVQRTINLRPEDMGKHQCTREVAYLRSGSRDLLRPLRFKLNYEIIQREPEPMRDGGPMPNVDDFPILDQQEAVKYFEAHFVRDCGEDNACDSDLNTIAAFQLPWDSSQSHQVFELGKRNMAMLETFVTNAGDPAYEPNLYVRHHESMAFSVKDSDTGSFLCVPARSNLVHCTLGNPLTNGTGPLLLAFKPSGFFDKRFIHFRVFANSTSNELTPEKPLELVLEILKRAEISITGSVEPEQVFFGGDIVGESAIKSLRQIGAEVVHKYVVDNGGPWRVDYVAVDIHWPHQVENFLVQGKWLLYLTGVPTVDGDGECEVDPALVDPVHLAEKWSSSSSFSPFESVRGEVEVPDEVEEKEQPPPDTHRSSVVVKTTNKTVSRKVVTTSKVNKIRTETSKIEKKETVTESSSASSRSQNYDRKFIDYDDENYEDYPEDEYYDEDYTDEGSNDEIKRIKRDQIYSPSKTMHKTLALRRNEYETTDMLKKSSPGNDRRSYIPARNIAVAHIGVYPQGDSLSNIVLHEYIDNIRQNSRSNIPVLESRYKRKKKETKFSLGLGDKQYRDTFIRVKRDRMVAETEAYTDDKTGRTLQVVNLRCSGDTPTAKCIRIRCNIRNLGAESSASIRVASRLWNATLVEDYAHVNLVNIESRGELLLPEDVRYRQDQSDDVATAETKAYANLLEQTKAVPLWVILVSIFAGLLILVLIILLLWKMGFFQRKRPGSRNITRSGL